MTNKIFIIFAVLSFCSQAAAETVRFTGKDDFIIYGDYTKASNRDSSKGVLMLHQCNNRRTMYDGLATSLAEAGFHSMSIDFRGFGESVTDEVSIENIREKATSREHFFEMFDKLALGKNRGTDVELAYNYLIAKLGSDAKVSVIGASCGGHEAIKLALKHEPESFIFFSSGMDEEVKGLFDQVSEVPALIIAAEGDTFTFESSNEIFLKAKNEDTRLLLYKGKDHGLPLFAKDPDLENLMVRWFQRHH